MIKNTNSQTFLPLLHIQKLPYIKKFLTKIKQDVITHCEYYCKNANIKIVFLPFKAGAVISVKEPVPNFPRSYFVCMVTFLSAMPVALVK